MWQWFLVATLVLVSAVYAAWALLPAATRLRLARRLASIPGPSRKWVRASSGRHVR